MRSPTKDRLIKTLGHTVGFDRIGIAPVGPLERHSYYRDWLAAGYGGSLSYLARNVPLRENPSHLLPNARSVICVALNYKRPSATAPGDERPQGHVATYARGRDYHVVIREMLGELVDRLREQFAEPFEARICVDTAPVLERELARAAGLGWIGKNTCLLDRQLGSYLFLGEVITTLDLGPDEPVPDRCGRCTRCLEACPTGALRAPYQLDASRCISYLTIEHRGEIAAEFHTGIGDRVFGCDICQEVCPYNRRSPLATHPAITGDHTPALVDLLDLLKLRSAEYRRLTKGSAARRARRSMWHRNAAIALGNAGPLSSRIAGEVKLALEEAARNDDAGIRQAAINSIARLSI